MLTYRLNMAREFVMSLDARNKWLRWFFVYLFVCSVMITWVLFEVIQKASRWHSRREVVARQEVLFLDGHPGVKSLLQYKGMIQGEVVASRKDVDALVGFEQHRAGAARLLLGLVEPLPSGVELGAADLDAEALKLRFEIVMPITLKMDDKLSPTYLVSMWEKEPLLTGRLTQFEVDNNERVRRDGAEMMCWRFSASVGEK